MNITSVKNVKQKLKASAHQNNIIQKVQTQAISGKKIFAMYIFQRVSILDKICLWHYNYCYKRQPNFLKDWVKHLYRLFRK